jgi:hypothetical protein
MPPLAGLNAGTRIFAIHVCAALTIGTVVAAVIAGAVTGSSTAGSVSTVAGSVGGPGGAAVRGVAVPFDIRVEFVRFPRPFIYVIADGAGLCRLLVCVLAQPRRFNLRLFCIRPGACRLCFALPGVKFLVLGLAANLGCLLAVRVIPLLLYCLPAPSCCEQQQHNQHHHNYGNQYPNPRSYFQITHHFHFDVTGPAGPFRLTFLEPFITRLASVLTFH